MGEVDREPQSLRIRCCALFSQEADQNEYAEVIGKSEDDGVSSDLQIVHAQRFCHDERANAHNRGGII